MGEVIDALRGRFQTRDIAKTPAGRFNALMRKEKGDTARVAARLGVTRRTVQRWAQGTRNIANTKPDTLKRLEAEVRRDHQPRVTKRAAADAKQRGVFVETRARFGFRSAAGSTDDPRMRRLSEDLYLSDQDVERLFDALRDGDEDTARAIISEGLAQQYFRDGGTRADSLDVDFNLIDYIELDYSR